MIIKDPTPVSSFLSIEKDMNLIVDKMIKNKRLLRLLYYKTPDALDRPNISQQNEIDLVSNNIKIIPYLQFEEHNTYENYILINFKKFTPNETNPEFRDNIVQFDVVCHYDQWHLKDFQLRPFKIAAELDSMFNDSRLTGIGRLKFLGAHVMTFNDGIHGGVCLTYQAIHGEEDKKNFPTPQDQIVFDKDFVEMIESD